ncbi:hypothetical protein R5R35_006096 [Gryllus longicercus]|uniref:Uncharacterized protein n=1 Tax=Gryllus longicercus TaxID=2509291 RepID=A0AAN9ZDV6_9ORTH
MRREMKTRPVVGVLILAVLLAAPTLVTSTRRYGDTEPAARDIVPEVNFEGDFASDDATSAGESAWAWVEGPWLALLLPFVLGLGLLQVTLFHTAACCVVARLKAGRRGGGWRATAAGALGVACGAQLLLLAGLGLAALRVHQAMRRGAFASASRFADFFPGHEVWQPLQPFLWAIPVLIICYWIMLSILCKIEEKKKRRKEERKEKLVQGKTDISIIKITKL